MFATQEVEGSIDYTNKEYLRMVQHVQNACERLSRNGEINARVPPGGKGQSYVCGNGALGLMGVCAKAVRMERAR